MEITSEIMQGILNAYPYEIVYVDRHENIWTMDDPSKPITIYPA